MSINCGRSTTDIDTTEDSANGKPTFQPFSLSNDFCTKTTHGLVQQMTSRSKTATGQEDEHTTASKSSSSAMHIGEQLWGLQGGVWPPGLQASNCVVKASGHGPSASSRQECNSARRPGTQASLHPYTFFSVPKQEAWFKKLGDPSVTEKTPNQGQVAFLRSIADRCAAEALLYNRPEDSGHSRATSDPIQVALLAPPGTGKTFCIKTVCSYFREVLNWTDGVEFQCVASQNRMSGRIDGATLHAWGQVPTDSETQPGQDVRRLAHVHKCM